MDACITGIGWVTKSGMGPESQLKKRDVDKGLPLIRRKDVMDHPYKPFGRMDHFSKLGFAAILFALNDAGMKKGSVPNDTGIIASTTTGCLETDTKYWKTLADKVPSPAVFAYTLDSCFIGEASIYHGLTGESFIVNEDNTCGLLGLYFACDKIQSGHASVMLCGICNSDIQFDKSDMSKIIPGALFLVIEKKTDPTHVNYGRITAVCPDTITFENGTRVNDLHHLAGVLCTKTKRKS